MSVQQTNTLTDLLEFLKGFTDEGKDCTSKHLEFILQTFSEISKNKIFKKNIPLLATCCLKFIDFLLQFSKSVHMIDAEHKTCVHNYFSVLNDIGKRIELRNNFLEETAVPLLERIIDPSVNSLYGQELARILNTIAQNSSRSLKNKIVKFSAEIYIYKLTDLLGTCGDYEYQRCLIQILFQMCSSDFIFKHTKEFFPGAEDLQQCFMNMKTEDFDRTLRRFLNTINHINRHVFSVIAVLADLDEFYIDPPVSDGGYNMDLWVDFNVLSYTIGIFCKKISFVEHSLSQEEEWELLTFFVRDISFVQLKREKIKSTQLLKFSVLFHKSAPCHHVFCTSAEAASANILKLIIQNEDVDELKNVLSNMFREKFEAFEEANQNSQALENYIPELTESMKAINHIRKKLVSTDSRSERSYANALLCQNVEDEEHSITSVQNTLINKGYSKQDRSKVFVNKMVTHTEVNKKNINYNPSDPQENYMQFEPLQDISQKSLCFSNISKNFSGTEFRDSLKEIDHINKGCVLNSERSYPNVLLCQYAKDNDQTSVQSYEKQDLARVSEKVEEVNKESSSYNLSTYKKISARYFSCEENLKLVNKWCSLSLDGQNELKQLDPSNNHVAPITDAKLQKRKKKEQTIKANKNIEVLSVINESIESTLSENAENKISANKNETVTGERKRKFNEKKKSHSPSKRNLRKKPHVIIEKINIDKYLNKSSSLQHLHNEKRACSDAAENDDRSISSSIFNVSTQKFESQEEVEQSSDILKNELPSTHHIRIFKKNHNSQETFADLIQRTNKEIDFVPNLEPVEETNSTDSEISVSKIITTVALVHEPSGSYNLRHKQKLIKIKNSHVNFDSVDVIEDVCFDKKRAGFNVKSGNTKQLLSTYDTEKLEQNRSSLSNTKQTETNLEPISKMNTLIKKRKLYTLVKDVSKASSIDSAVTISKTFDSPTLIHESVSHTFQHKPNSTSIKKNLNNEGLNSVMKFNKKNVSDLKMQRSKEAKGNMRNNNVSFKTSTPNRKAVNFSYDMSRINNKIIESHTRHFPDNHSTVSESILKRGKKSGKQILVKDKNKSGEIQKPLQKNVFLSSSFPADIDIAKYREMFITHTSCFNEQLGRNQKSLQKESKHKKSRKVLKRKNLDYPEALPAKQMSSVINNMVDETKQNKSKVNTMVVENDEVSEINKQKTNFGLKNAQVPGVNILQNILLRSATSSVVTNHTDISNFDTNLPATAEHGQNNNLEGVSQKLLFHGVEY